MHDFVPLFDYHMGKVLSSHPLFSLIDGRIFREVKIARRK
jgi:hypothetical protein